MRRSIQSFNCLSRPPSGQAMVEYLLMLAVAISLLAVMGSSFRKTLTHLWGFYTRQVSAACPQCPADPAYRFR